MYPLLYMYTVANGTEMTQVINIGDIVQKGDLVIRRLGDQYLAQYAHDNPKLLGYGEVGIGINPIRALDNLNSVLYAKDARAKQVVIRRRIEAGWDKKRAKKTAMPWQTNKWDDEPELVQEKGGYE